jgi:hypothetical protein
MSMKYFSDTLGNRTRDLPDCSAVPQPNVPPRAPSASYTADMKFLPAEYEILHKFLCFKYHAILWLEFNYPSLKKKELFVKHEVIFHSV